jgi:hypothetical protein
MRFVGLCGANKKNPTARGDFLGAVTSMQQGIGRPPGEVISGSRPM